MSLNIKTTTDTDEVADFIASAVLSQLKLNKKVLLFVTGGSSIIVCIKVSEILREHPHQNLTVMLTDERYGEVNHADSNWGKLIKGGFSLPEAKLIPILTGEDHATATKEFNENLEREFKNADYKIGIFGVGPDGHTAGILPGSSACHSQDLGCGYDSEIFSRITMTFKAILKLDEVIAWIQGENKWGVIKDLEEKDIELEKQPAQILEKVPSLTIFTDYKE
jgi:6-phosphogluconolactonase/glucosamine-6-phosphate isomerase/deaminase